MGKKLLSAKDLYSLMVVVSVLLEGISLLLSGEIVMNWLRKNPVLTT